MLTMYQKEHRFVQNTVLLKILSTFEENNRPKYDYPGIQF